MIKNEILEELYAIREKLLSDAGGDIHAYLAGVREREALSGRLLKTKPESVIKKNEVIELPAVCEVNAPTK